MFHDGLVLSSGRDAMDEWRTSLCRLPSAKAAHHSSRNGRQLWRMRAKDPLDLWHKQFSRVSRLQCWLQTGPHLPQACCGSNQPSLDRHNRHGWTHHFSIAAERCGLIGGAVHGDGHLRRSSTEAV